MRRELIILLNVVMALVVLGSLLVFSAGTVHVYDEEGNLRGFDKMFYLRPHLFHLALGLLALVLASRFDYHRLADRPILFGLIGASLVLLVWVLVLNIERKGAVRWIQLAGFSFQPSEFAKLVLVVWLAVRLAESSDRVRTFYRGFLPPMGIVALFMVLILAERDLGAPVVIGVTGLLMCLVAGVRWPFIAGTAVTGVGFVYALCRTTGYRWERIVAWLDPWEHPDTPQGYQLIQSLGAFARGGFWGKGPGGSQQKLFYLPEAKNDFIFAMCGEEMGLAGTLLVVVLFALFLIMAIRVAVCARDRLGALLAGGVATLISFQALWNIAMTTGLSPTKGLPLPFISAGGSALIVNLALVGMLVNVGLQARQQEKPALASAVQ